MSRRAGSDAPAVSVIIPAYNAGAYIGRTLQSVKQQTLRDLEVIVVDDGSTDDTAEVVRAWAQGDGRIRLIRQARSGQAAARNRAIADARGRYVANLDADDLWRSAFLARTVAALESRGPKAPFAFARSLWIGPDDRIFVQKPIPLPVELHYRDLLLRNPVGNGSAALMRTDAVRACGGYDEALVARFRQAEDWMLQLRLSWLGPAPVIDEPLVLYRIWSGSTSHRVEEAVAACMEVIRRCRAEGPPLSAGDYRSAASLMLLWHARRAWRLNDRRLALRLLLRAYGRNPAWFTVPELRAQMASSLRKAGRAIAARPAPEGATSAKQQR
jgi:glycosyltransferase involved in cell wall biosynthesis